MIEGRKIDPVWILTAMFVAVPILGMASCLGLKAFQARRPKDMPASSIWIDAPAVPFGFYHGWWEGCWIESDGQTNHCRLYGPELSPPIIFEGRFMPCGALAPIPVSELKLKPPPHSPDMWIFPGFIAFLEDGRILVPLENVGDCPKIRDRLEREKTAGF